MYCCEALDSPLEDLNYNNQQRFRAIYRNGIKTILFPKKISDSLRVVMECIEDYSEKSLTNSVDILKGILGIQRAFEAGVLGLYRRAHFNPKP
jgi:hypothetical protein